MQPKPIYGRRNRDRAHPAQLQPTPRHGRTLSGRRHVEAGRGPRLGAPVSRPPLLEAAVTVTVFLFLACLVLFGGGWP
jgi:hypothetical protein